MVAKLYRRHGGAIASTLDEITDRVPFLDAGQPAIQMGMACQNGSASQGTYIVVDPIGNADEAIYHPAHSYIRWTEDAPGCEYWLAVGRVSGLEIGRGVQLSENHLEWDITTDDANVDVTGLAFTEDWVRPEETDTERIYALQAYTLNATDSTRADVGGDITYRPSTLIIASDSHLAPDDNTVTMPAKTYPAGTQPQEVIDDCASTAGKVWGVVIHHAPLLGDESTLASWTFPSSSHYADDTGHGYLIAGTWDGGAGEAGWATSHLYSGYDNPTSSHIPFTAGSQIKVEMDVAWRYNQSSDFCALSFLDESFALLEEWKFAEGVDYPGGGAIYHVDTDYHTAPAGTAYFTFGVAVAPGISVEWDNVVLSQNVPTDDCSHLCMFYTVEDDHTTYATAAKISDELSEWDPDDLTAPVWEPHWDQGKGTVLEGQSQISGLVSRYGLGDKFLVAIDSFYGDPYEYWTDSYSDSDSVTLTQASQRAAAIIKYRTFSGYVNRVTVAVHPEQTNLLTAGMSIQVKTAVTATGTYLGYYIDRRIVQCSWEPRPDGMYWAHLELNRGIRRMPASRGKPAAAATTPSDAATLPYNPATSGMAATNLQDAADELDSRVDALEAAPGLTEITDLPTSETNTTLVLHPDGAGGVEWDVDATGGGGVATDPIWDTKGDLAAATGADAAVKVPVGANGTVLLADSTQTSGVRWGSVGSGVGGGVADFETYLVTLSGLVHRWEFEEASGNFADSVGSLDLVPSGTVSYHNAGLVGAYAAGFSAGGYVRTSAGALGSIPTGAAARTIITIYKTSGVQTAKAALNSYGPTGATGEWWMAGINEGTWTTELDVWASDLIGATKGAGDGNWHLTAQGHDGNRMTFTYIDGHIDFHALGGALATGSGTTGFTVAQSSNIGSFSLPFTGYIDDLLVFNTFLNKAQLDQLFLRLAGAL